MTAMSEYGGMSMASESICCEKCGRAFATAEKHGVWMESVDLYVRGREKPVRLSFTQSLLIKFLLERFGQYVHKQRIFSHVWGSDSEVQDKITDIIICQIRKKIRDLPIEIRTSWGVGWGVFFRDPVVGNVGQSGTTFQTKPTEITTNADQA